MYKSLWCGYCDSCLGLLLGNFLRNLRKTDFIHPLKITALPA